MAEPVIIYVTLLSEPDIGVNRPVHAEPLEDGAFRILGPQADPDEVWMFGPGSLVFCREQLLQPCGEPCTSLLIADRLTHGEEQPAP